MAAPINLKLLRQRFGEHLQENVVLANYTTVRAGGAADALLPVNSSEELENAVKILWDIDIPFMILGSGSNILASDQGMHAVVIFNRSRNIKIEGRLTPPIGWAESGANLAHFSRQIARRGYSGMEWAASIPGTVGGAVYGNAGAYGSDMASSLGLVEILHRNEGKTSWSVERLDYNYRSSLLKRECLPAVVLAASVRLEESTPEVVQEKMKQNIAHRLLTQPPGASMGSMFKNPPGDYAGRLIEAAGLKGRSIGSVEISDLHGNFCINLGKANAKDVYSLIRLAQKTVEDKFGISLELEIELVGDWKEEK